MKNCKELQNKVHQPTHLLNHPILAIEMLNISNSLDIIYLTISLNQQESRHLAALRDTLLPKLMSGELDVSDIHL